MYETNAGKVEVAPSLLLDGWKTPFCAALLHVYGLTANGHPGIKQLRNYEGLENKTWDICEYFLGVIIFQCDKILQDKKLSF